MNGTRRIHLLAFALVGLVAAAPASAQATRTWVSGVGDDANPCSRTAPCKTFAGAISKTAAGGEISVLDPGGFGGVTITKSISIVADGSEGGLLVSGTNAIIVNAAAGDNVTIRGLTLEGLGTGLSGVRFLAGGSLSVENCTINNFTTGIDFQPSGAAELYVRNTVIRQTVATTGGGILIKPGVAGSATALIDHSSVANHRFGLRAEAASKVTVRDSTMAGNGTNGFLAISTGTAVELNLENVVSSGNVGAGVRSEGAAATVRVFNSSVLNNGTGFQAVTGGQILSFGQNRNAGNTTAGAPTGPLALQ